MVKLIEYCFDHQIFVILKLSRKYIMFIFLAAVVNQSSHLTSISAASLWKTWWLSVALNGSLLEIWLVEKVGYILTYGYWWFRHFLPTLSLPTCRRCVSKCEACVWCVYILSTFWYFVVWYHLTFSPLLQRFLLPKTKHEMNARRC